MSLQVGTAAQFYFQAEVFVQGPIFGNEGGEYEGVAVFVKEAEAVFSDFKFGVFAIFGIGADIAVVVSKIISHGDESLFFVSMQEKIAVQFIGDGIVDDVVVKLNKKGVGSSEARAVGQTETSPESPEDEVAFVAVEEDFIIFGNIADFAVSAVEDIGDEADGLVSVDEGQFVFDLVFVGVPVLEGEVELVASAGKVGIGQLYAEVGAIEFVILFNPPDVEVSVGEFEDGDWPDEPAFDDADDHVDVSVFFPVAQVDAHDGEETGIHEEEFVIFEALGQFGEGDGIADAEIQFPGHDFFPGFFITFYAYAIDDDIVGLWFGLYKG